MSDELTRRQTALIKESFVFVSADGRIASLFYARLFHDNPHLKDLFEPDLGPLKIKFAETLSIVVDHAAKLDEIGGEIEELGRKHVEFLVKDSDYSPTGEALIWALQLVHGDDWTYELETAWRKAYRLIVDRMLEGARKERVYRSYQAKLAS